MQQGLTLADGTRLHLREWPCRGGPAGPKGTVLIVHGLGEHIGRYPALADRLNAAGWSVAGYDHRGHGASAGARGGVPHGDALLTDLAEVVDALEPVRPLVLLGHSMGGCVAARFVAEGLVERPAGWHRPVDALVLSSPALAADLNFVQRVLLATMLSVAPHLAVANGLDPAWISRDPAAVAAYKADPLVHDRISPRLARFIVDAGAQVRALAARWTVPTLLMWGGADRCVAPRGSAQFAGAARSGVVSAREFAPLAHEIFNEPERDEVFAVLLAWLDRHAGGGPP